MSHDGLEVARYPRTIGRQARIDYRHVVASLIRKPGAFAGYIYREELFPRAAFRQAYDRLRQADELKADRRYIELLALAAQWGEEEVAAAIGALLRRGCVPWPDDVEQSLGKRDTKPPELASFTPELQSYDTLITEVSA